MKHLRYEGFSNLGEEPVDQTYDALYRVNTITDSIGQIAQFSWNPQGLPLTMKDARVNTSSYSYDSYGNRTSYIDPEGRATSTTYNAFGQKLSETDARGNKTTYTNDDLGRMVSMTDPDNRTTTYEHDANGNKTAEVDPLTRRTTFEYDVKNRLIKTTYPDLTFTSKTYDFRGNVLTANAHPQRGLREPARWRRQPLSTYSSTEFFADFIVSGLIKAGKSSTSALPFQPSPVQPTAAA